jgi:four helix bundle protein
MNEESIIPTKSFQFALKIIRIYQTLTMDHKEYVMSKQLLRSGTSIGANVAESGAAYSRKEFEFKLSLAYKEARESSYWLRLIFASQYLNESNFIELKKDIEELQKLIGSTLVTLRKQQKSN